jgi:hypothetical protein
MAGLRERAMTLKLKPVVVFSVTKKPDGRLVLNYTPPESSDGEFRIEGETKAPYRLRLSSGTYGERGEDCVQRARAETYPATEQ